jgi:hypothetical protein
VAVDADVGHLFQEPVTEEVPEPASFFAVAREVAESQLGGHAEAEDADVVVGAGPQAVFLVTAGISGSRGAPFLT